jgi:hypothetical protein
MKYRILGILGCLFDFACQCALTLVELFEGEETVADRRYSAVMVEILACRSEKDLEDTYAYILNLYTEFKSQLPYEELVRRNDQLQKLWRKQKDRLDSKRMKALMTV